MVECLLCKQNVAGSNPTTSTNLVRLKHRSRAKARSVWGALFASGEFVARLAPLRCDIISAKQGVAEKWIDMNWNQTGMPTALVSRLGLGREVSEFKSVLNDAQNQVMQSVDVEAMAQKLVESGGREFVEMVRGLTAALANAKKDLEDANRRYERLTADLARRGISVEGADDEVPAESQPREPESILEGMDEWEAWDRKFRALLG